MTMGSTTRDERLQFTLGELCSHITDGKHGDCQDQPRSGFYFLSVKDIIGNRLIYENARQITERDFSETNRRTNLQPGDTLFTNTGTIGRIAIAGEDPRTYKTTFQKSVAILKARRDLIEPDFLYYLLHFENARLSELAAGTTQKNLLLKDIRTFEVTIPPLPEQRAVAQILRTLDDKIELNRRMNRTLEEMARAIFQDWFVDFGPTRAKMERQEPYLPPELWGLFPDQLVDSELGEIPEGWEIKPLGEIIELAYGKALKAGDRKGGTVPVYGSNGQVGWHDEKLVSGPGIIVGRKGNPGKVTWSHDDFFPIDTAFYVVPESPDPALHFLYYALTNQDLSSIAADSAVPGLNRNLAYMNDQLVPKRSLMEIYASYVDGLFIRMDLLDNESQDLTLLRDALLPRLVSGELTLERDRQHE